MESSRLVRRVGILVPCLLASTLGHPQKLVRIHSEDATDPTEVSVAIHPTDRNRILAVSMQRGDKTANFVYVSKNGGDDWEQTRGPNPNDRTQGDDALAFDGAGRAFWTYISFDGLRELRPERARNGIFLNRSINGGVTWEAPRPIVDHINTVAPFEDKPYLAVDTVRGSPHEGRVYVSWTRFSLYGSADPRETSDIYFSTSSDGGERFSMPIRVSDVPGDATDSDGTLEGAVPAVGTNGEVYLVWGGPRGLVFDRSLDGGVSFGEDQVLTKTPGGWDIEVPGILRANGMPVTGVDHSDGSNRDRLYVNWIDHRNETLDVFLAWSDDRGESWTEPTRVRESEPSGDQFLTWMAVDPLDGSVNIAFYDRGGLSGSRTGVSLARSIDGGSTFKIHSIAPGLLDSFQTHEDVFFGDYLGIAARGGLVVTAFSHFVGEKSLALSAAIHEFELGTQRLQK